MRQELANVETSVRSMITALLARRGAAGIEITPESRFAEDLDMDSLELAELSAALEDEFGRDPYSEGIVPQTLAELLRFYES